MRSRTFRLLVLLTAVLLAGENRVRAEMINFSYSWTALPSSVIPGGTGSVTLAVTPDASASAPLNSRVPTLIPGATITTTSGATDIPDTFNTSFSMKLHLIDTASGAAGDLTFKGTIQGTLTATQSTLVSTFEDPLTQQLTLGNYKYSVTIDPALINLPAPGATTTALIDALVNVTPKGRPIPRAPEPSSLLLGATALLGLATRRALARRRRA